MACHWELVLKVHHSLLLIANLVFAGDNQEDQLDVDAEEGKGAIFDLQDVEQHPPLIENNEEVLGEVVNVGRVQEPMEYSLIISFDCKKRKKQCGQDHDYDAERLFFDMIYGANIMVDGDDEDDMKLKNKKWSPSLLGYFLQPIFACDDDDILERPQFMYISDKVKELQETNRGTIDASLSFLEDQIHDEAIEIVGSSNGYLLCCVNTHYIICNPVTREWKTLPEPHKSYEYAPLAFVCRGANNSSLDGITFEIFRVGVSNPRELATTLDMEIFSSLTNEWRESSFIPDSPFLLVVANVPAFVFGDVILWRDMRNKLVAYNRAEECVQVLDLPWNDDDNKYLGLSEGKIHYATLADKGHYFEMWVLEDYRRIESESAWMMKYRLSFDTICKENPKVRIRKNYVVALEGYNVGIEVTYCQSGICWDNQEDQLDVDAEEGEGAVFDLQDVEQHPPLIENNEEVLGEVVNVGHVQEPVEDSVYITYSTINQENIRLGTHTYLGFTLTKVLVKTLDSGAERLVVKMVLMKILVSCMQAGDEYTGSPSLLGYFLQPIFACDDDDILERPQFMYISDEVKELQETNRGTIDASLSFLEDQIHDEAIEIVGSSNGYLLCCVNTHYIICNPVTREWKTLPEPHKSYEYAPLAFVCRGANNSSLDGITFEIFRVGVSNPMELATTLDMEIFSFVFGDVILWRDMRNKLVAYNRAEECVQVLDLPWNDDDNKYLGLSEGKIHYATLADKGHYFEMWVLEDYRRIESESAWMMKYRLSFDTICKENPRVRIRKNYVVALEGYNVGIEGFHPFNSQVVILINFDGKPYWFDLESCNLKEFKGYKFLMPSYFPYECSSSISEA
ncbi:hypothetical protein ACH5RR_037869 [Cinchona calisaya]|uniref:F-box protein At3g26010-like beta-propeller domain-containing protein n=1 Tax=Cinchona calisaya TaxID=153742 RepID=A0ABD2Y8M2_9GENT